ncbi:MAG: glycosyltransferase family 4 protein [Planctomycetota bacterium]
MNIFYANFHLGWGGQPLQVLQLATAMQNRGHNIKVFSPPESDLVSRCVEAGIETETCCRFRRGFRPVNLYKDVNKLIKKCRQFDTDIIHCHGSQDTWTSAAAIKLGRLKAGLIRTKHNSYKPANHLANRLLYNSLISHTIAVAGPIADDLLADNFVAADKVSVIHAGLADNFSLEDRVPAEKIRKDLSIPENAYLIGLVGRLAPDKGQDTLLKAAEEIIQEIPEAHILLVGTGGDWDRIKSLISELNLKNKVTWAGFRSDISSITASLDVSLLAARACDASSTVLKEAMILRVPVVATDVGGTSEIVDDGKCGLLVKPGDPESLAAGIIKTFKDKESSAQRVNRAAIHVMKFLASEIAIKTENIYNRVLSCSGDNK